MLKQIRLLVLFCFNLNLYALEEPDYIEFGGMLISQKSNITPMNLKQSPAISSLDQSEIIQNEIDPYATFQYKYNYNDLSYVAILDYEGKLSLDIHNGLFATEIFEKPYFEYKNPYKLNSKRETIYAQDIGIAEHYTVVSKDDYKFDLAYFLSNKELLDDALAQEIPSLKREGNTHRIECSSENEFFRLASGLFTTQNMGDAENHKGIDLKLSSEYKFNNLQIYGDITLNHITYDNTNPIFDTTNKLYNIKTSLYGEYDFSKSQYYSIVGVSINRQYSNISFFNESNKILSIGIGKNFKTY